MAVKDVLTTLNDGLLTVNTGGTFTYNAIAYTLENVNALHGIILRVRILAIDEAIDAILLGAQSYSIEGRAFSKANLDSLRELKKWLVGELAERTGQRPVVKNVNFGSAGYVF